MFKNFLVALLVIATLNSNAQSYKKTDNGAKSVVNTINIEIQFYTPEVVRVIKHPVAANFDKRSFTVIQHPAKTAFTVASSNNQLVLKSKALKVTLDLKSGKIQYYTVANKLLLAENGAQFNPVTDGNKNTFDIAQDFTIDANEAIYGLGQHQKG
ncbi:MAG TPA: hypothetical protein VL490_02540, partial [Mucilaginibacter sp.]|nr:hypothetical protein [Mucilaginibacter sp.]